MKVELHIYDMAVALTDEVFRTRLTRSDYQKVALLFLNNSYAVADLSSKLKLCRLYGLKVGDGYPRAWNELRKVVTTARKLYEERVNRGIKRVPYLLRILELTHILYAIRERFESLVLTDIKDNTNYYDFEIIKNFDMFRSEILDFDGHNYQDSLLSGVEFLTKENANKLAEVLHKLTRKSLSWSDIDIVNGTKRRTLW